jgi:hypothetical protein
MEHLGNSRRPSKVSFREPSLCSTNQSRISKNIIILSILAQLMIFGNGALTLAVSVTSAAFFKQALYETVPVVFVLNDLSWNNWKIMETMARSFVNNRSDTSDAIATSSYDTAHERFMIFERDRAIDNKSEYELASSLIDQVPSLRNTSWTQMTFTPEFDSNMFALHAELQKLLQSFMRQTMSACQANLFQIEVTRIVNIVVIVLASVLRLFQVGLFPRQQQRKLTFLAGSGAVFGLSVLECAALIIITSYLHENLEIVALTYLPLYELAWMIKIHDPILTGATLRYALSQGNSSWKTIYDNALDPLTGNISLAMRLSDGAHQTALYKMINDSNTVLVQHEMATFLNASNGRNELLSSSYQTQKIIYLQSVDLFASEQSLRLTSALSSAATLCSSLIFFAALLTGMGLLVFLTDISRIFIADLAEREQQLNRQRDRALLEDLKEETELVDVQAWAEAHTVDIDGSTRESWMSRSIPFQRPESLARESAVCSAVFHDDLPEGSLRLIHSQGSKSIKKSAPDLSGEGNC